MTQANTYNQLLSELAGKNGEAVKKVLFYGDNAYLWSTENGYEFLIEDKIEISDENEEDIIKAIEDYETYPVSRNISAAIQEFKDGHSKASRLIENLKQEGREAAGRLASGLLGRKGTDPDRNGLGERTSEDSSSRKVRNKTVRLSDDLKKLDEMYFDAIDRDDIETIALT